MKLGLLTAFFASALAACSASTDDARPVETIAPEDWNVVLALVPDGEAIYAPRLTRLDVHALDGTVRTAAGVTYAGCPEKKDERWGPTFLDRGYPSFVVHHGHAYLAHSFCGLWSVDLANGEVKSLIAGPFGIAPNEPHWGGKPNVLWHAAAPFTFAPLGEDLAVCLSVDRLRERVEKKTDEPDRIELWRVGLDGSAKEKLAALDPRDKHCTQVLADGDTLFLATDHAIYRWDSATKAITTLTTDAGTSFGHGLYGVAQDRTNLYFLRNSALERVAKDGSSRTVLLPRPADLEAARLIVATDGSAVYWVEDRSLWRMPALGGTAERLVHGDEQSGVFPSALAITPTHIWYQRAKQVPRHEITDPVTGITLDDIRLHFAIERVAK